MTKFRWLKTAAAAAVAAAVCGCSTPKYEPADLVDFEPALTVTEVWNEGVPDSEGFLVPAVYENSVWVAGGDRLYRMNADDGSVEWKISFDADITGGVGTDGYITAVALENGTLQVIDGEGKVQWNTALTSQLSSPPVVAHDLVIVRTADTRVTAFSAATGEQKWTYQRTQPALTVRVPNEMVVRETLLFVGQANGQIVILDIPSGRPVFEFPVGEPKGITEVERLIDVVGAPAVTPEMLCGAAYQGAVTCVDGRSGQPMWSQKADAVAGPAIDDDNVYVVEADGVVRAFYKESGEPRWTNKTMTYRGLTAPVAVPGAVAVGDEEGYIHFLSPRTGEEIARERLSGPVVTPAQPYQGGAIFQTSNGDVAYFATR